MRPVLSIALVLLWPVLAWGSQLAATLAVAERQDPAARPYATARLSLVNAAGRAVEAVVLRPIGGGPAVRQPFSLAPGQTGQVDLPLPAIWPVQRYELTAEDAAGAVLGVATVGITWPEEHLATAEFIDDGFLAWRDIRVGWPGRFRRNVVLLLVLFVVAAAAALFIRRWWLRAGAVLVLSAGATVLVISAGWPEAVQQTQYTLVRYVPACRPRVESFLVLSARRSSRVSLTTAGRLPYPVYPDRASAGCDESLVEPALRRITLALRSGEVRIVRPGPRPYRPAPGTVGQVRRGPAGGLSIVAEMDHRRALVIFEDRCWSVPAGMGRLEMVARAEEARPMAFDPALCDRRSWRLLEYWRGRYLRPGRVYLVNFAAAGGNHRLEVLELAERKPAGPGGEGSRAGGGSADQAHRGGGEPQS